MSTAHALRLEFTCTEAETKQARSLLLQHQIGGGSKLLTNVLLLVAVIGMLLGFYFRVRREVAPAHRPFIFLAAFGAAMFMWYLQRRLRRFQETITRLEISDRGLSLRGRGAEVKMPWSAFGRCLQSPDLFALVDRSNRSLLVIPKRAFPDEASHDWFATLATNQIGLPDQPSASPPPPALVVDEGSLRLKVQLGFLDHLDRTVASWKTRGFFLFITAMVMGVGIYSSANPPPNPVFSTAQVFLFFMLPFLLVMMGALILLGTLHTWWTHGRHSVPQELAICRDSITFSSSEASGAMPWSAYTHFKETRWSFFLWNARNSAWMMLPKRAFRTSDDIESCRSILALNLKPSRWFFC